MELLKDIIVDFCLFSLIEGWVLAQFYEKICNCRKFKWWQIIILSFGNCIISQMFSPLLYQILMILWMGLFISVINQKNKFLLSFLSMIFLLIIEMNYSYILSLFNIMSERINYILLFIYILPMRLIEILIIKGGVKMKAWIGSVEK